MDSGYYDAKFLKSRGLIFSGRYLPYNPDLNDRAKHMRINMTDSESKLWNKFLKKLRLINVTTLHGGKFKKIRVLRQKVIDNYIVDFYISELKLVIEIDGEIHNDRVGYDKVRTEILEGYGLKEIRFTNEQIDNDFENVCLKLESLIFKNEKFSIPLNKGLGDLPEKSL